MENKENQRFEGKKSYDTGFPWQMKTAIFGITFFMLLMISCYGTYQPQRMQGVILGVMFIIMLIAGLA